jgi:hypothetical protein
LENDKKTLPMETVVGITASNSYTVLAPLKKTGSPPLATGPGLAKGGIRTACHSKTLLPALAFSRACLDQADQNSKYAYPQASLSRESSLLVCHWF